MYFNGDFVVCCTCKIINPPPPTHTNLHPHDIIRILCFCEYLVGLKKNQKIYELSQVPSFVFHLFEVEGAAHPPVCGEERENGRAVDLLPLPVATLKHGVLQKTGKNYYCEFAWNDAKYRFAVLSLSEKGIGLRTESETKNLNNFFFSIMHQTYLISSFLGIAISHKK